MNRYSGIESKKRIMNAAMDLFSRHGYAKANIREIAKAARISVGGVYLYFKNKEELYKSLINDLMREMGAKVETAVEQNQSAAEALSIFLKLYLEYALKHKEFLLIHIREYSFTFGMDEKRRFFRNQGKMIEKILV